MYTLDNSLVLSCCFVLLEKNSGEAVVNIGPIIPSLLVTGPKGPQDIGVARVLLL